MRGADELFVSDATSAVTLPLALPKNAERRSERAVQHKLDAIAAAMLEQQAGKARKALQGLREAIRMEGGAVTGSTTSSEEAPMAAEQPTAAVPTAGGGPPAAGRGGTCADDPDGRRPAGASGFTQTAPGSAINSACRSRVTPSAPDEEPAPGAAEPAVRLRRHRAAPGPARTGPPDRTGCRRTSTLLPLRCSAAQPADGSGLHRGRWP
ncbi:hypothetical protein UK12_04795 [Saccharothrix sp. ST-888]|nr:hypothetical protein UK12_04795 [Saccharothrix sp. ST-888]